MSVSYKTLRQVSGNWTALWGEKKKEKRKKKKKKKDN